ncbi:MAG: hypothetical protein OXG26_12540 [Caldilineaceae bacterium]|nr:hypothetical protein [Caldilineaceae bacterium]
MQDIVTVIEIPAASQTGRQPNSSPTSMPRFQRHSRPLNRLFFALVIAAGLFGWFYVSGNWQPDPSAFEISSLTGDADMIDVIAGLIEDAIQIFQEITG